MTEPQKTREGFSAWLGVLDAFKEAIDETIEELKERGDLSPDRARDAVKTAARKAQSAMENAKERLDFVPRREFDALRDEVAALRRRVDELGGGPGGGV